MLVGIDDTDSLKGGCTTQVAYEISKKTRIRNIRLIRLNPNIPHKTRGNGSVSFETDDTPQNRRTILETVRELSRVEDGAETGVVFVNQNSKSRSDLLYNFYRKAVSTLVQKEDAKKTAELVGAEVHTLSGGRGIIGALAAVGARLPDKTFELIAYRVKKNYGTERRIENDPVFLMDSKLYPRVFDSVDAEKKQVLITPRGYDPVFCGIRGESGKDVKRGWKMIHSLEEIDGFLVFETNQGTDAHLVEKEVWGIKPYDCVRVTGVVSRAPRTLGGGHVFFKLSDSSGVIDCGAYKPTGDFRDVVRKLAEGDLVVVCGGVSKYAGTLNIEKLYVKKLSRIFESRSPACCGKSMTSAGRGKGFKCRVCGRRKSSSAAEKMELPRGLSTGWYEVPPRARRHLSKPLVREKRPTT
jgi:tRNA(Ile2)-agmatinylcytidine synthase